MVSANFAIQPSQHYGEEGNTHVETPYGQGILLGLKGTLAQVKLRWGGIMTIQGNKIQRHASGLAWMTQQTSPNTPNSFSKRTMEEEEEDDCSSTGKRFRS